MQHTGFSLGIARGLSRSVVCWVLSFLDQGLIVSPLPWKADPSVVSTTGAGGKSLEVFFLLHFFSQSFVKRNRVNFLSLLHLGLTYGICCHNKVISMHGVSN